MGMIHFPWIGYHKSSHLWKRNNSQLYCCDVAMLWDFILVKSMTQNWSNLSKTKSFLVDQFVYGIPTQRIWYDVQELRRENGGPRVIKWPLNWFLLDPTLTPISIPPISTHKAIRSCSDFTLPSVIVTKFYFLPHPLFFSPSL